MFFIHIDEEVCFVVMEVSSRVSCYFHFLRGVDVRRLSLLDSGQFAIPWECAENSMTRPPASALDAAAPTKHG